MKKLTILIGVMMLLSISCSSPPPQELSKQAEELKPEAVVQTTEQKSQNEPKKEPPKPKVWPYISEQNKGYTMADNLLAKNYVVILDGSGSMEESDCSDGKDKISVAKNAIMEWSKTIPADSNLGLVSFHKRTDKAPDGWTVIELSPKSQSAPFEKAVRGIEPHDFTPLASAFKVSYGLLTKQAQKQLGYGEYTIVAVTDGADNDKRESLSKWVNIILQNTPIRIFTIGFCISGKHYLNQEGRTIYREANNPAQLKTGLKEVLAEAEKFDLTGFKQ